MRALAVFFSAIPTVAVGLASANAFADDTLAGEVPVQHIDGGQQTDECAWPTVAYLTIPGAACTGTLIHPEIVLTAAHCVPNDVSADVRFGESGDVAVQLAQTEYCKANPAFTGTGQGTDFGFCKLATPITTLPIVPVAYGCEETILSAGREVVQVGFGVDENGVAGRKKDVTMTVQGVNQQGEFITGTPTTGICSGDSGGPAFIQLTSDLGGDDTWRVVGIHSWAEMPSEGVCTGTRGNVIASNAIEWIEQESGVDVTPCFDVNGDWDPTWSCQGFPQDPGTGGGGSYQTQCDTGPLADYSQMCGPPLTNFPDNDAPTVSITKPKGDVQIQLGSGGTGHLQVTAEADDGNGWGIDNVALVIKPESGKQQSQALQFEPYQWNADFPKGGYSIKAVATDHAGNAAETPWVQIGVGVPPPADTPADTDGGSSGGTGGVGTTGGTGGPVGTTGDPSTGSSSGGGSSDTDPRESGGDPGGKGNCACTTGATPRGASVLVGILLVGLARRRRRAPRRGR